MHFSTPCASTFAQSGDVMPAQGCHVSGQTLAVVRSQSGGDAGVSRCNRVVGWLEASGFPGNPKTRNSLKIGAAQAAGLNYILRIVPGSCFPLNSAQARFAGETLSGPKPC